MPRPTVILWARTHIEHAMGIMKGRDEVREDIYNPLRFLAAGLKWCRKAAALGTLDDEAAAWMRKIQVAQ